MVTFGGVSLLEMAFGWRPADLLYPENMTPEQLTASLPSPEKNIDALRTLAMKSYLEAKQSDDLRRDISARLQLSDGPFYPGDKIYYWTEDKSKVKSDGTHSGKWIKGKVISSDGSTVGIDLGTRILKVNISKVRKDINPIEDVEVPLDPVALLSSESARTDIPVTDHASSLVQSDGAQIGVEGFTYSSYAWQPVMTGKIDFLELFAGSARLSQVAAMNGLRVGQPIDLRTGFDILTSDGRKRTMDIVEKQKPRVIFMAPHCAPWSQMTISMIAQHEISADRSFFQCWNFVVVLPYFRLNTEANSSLRILPHQLFGTPDVFNVFCHNMVLPMALLTCVHLE